MTDDWSTPTGEYEPPCIERRADASLRPPPPRRLSESGSGVTAGDLRILDAFLYELAREAAEDPSPPTAEQQAAVDQLRDHAERLEAMTPEEQEAERLRLLRIYR